MMNDERMTELKPCPFCGGDAETLISFRNVSGWFAFVQCRRCGIKSEALAVEVDNSCRALYSDLMKASGDAVRAWNRRTGG